MNFSHYIQFSLAQWVFRGELLVSVLRVAEYHSIWSRPAFDFSCSKRWHELIRSPFRFDHSKLGTSNPWRSRSPASPTKQKIVMYKKKSKKISEIWNLCRDPFFSLFGVYLGAGVLPGLFVVGTPAAVREGVDTPNREAEADVEL